MPKGKKGLFGGYASREEQLQAQIKEATGRKSSGSVEKDAEAYFPRKSKDPIKSQRRGGESSEETYLRTTLEKLRKEQAAEEKKGKR